MERKICANGTCRATNALQWRKGWPLRSGELIDLCDRCGSAYDNFIFCETFHSEQSGWRECEQCHKRVHCGCIVASSFIELMDFGGVRCVGCSKDSQLHLSNTAEYKVEEEEKSLHLYKFMDTDEPNFLRQPPNNNGPLTTSREISQGLKHPIGEVGGVDISNLSSNGSCILTQIERNLPLPEKLNDVHKALAHASLNISLATPAEGPNFILPSSSSTRDGSEQTPPLGPSSSFQLGPSSRPILPSLSLPGNTPNTVPGISRVMFPQVRVARPPAEGRGKNQLLPRYWPRITDQELQQLSGDLNSTIVPLFEKVLSASDAGRIGRLVLPKACAEAYFPHIDQSEGVPVRIQDVKGNEWTFQFRFWPNNNSRMYVLEGVTPCIQSMQLRAGDTVIFSRINPGGKLMMGFRKSSNSVDRQENGTSTLSGGTPNREAPFSSFMGSIPAGHSYSDLLNSLNGIKDPHISSPFGHINDPGGEFNWNKNKEIVTNAIHEEPSQQPQGSEKKKARNIGSKNRRLLMHCEDVMEVRLTWEEAQELLRPPPSVAPSIVTIDGHDFEEYDEPPVFGKRTICISRPSGGQEQWAQCDECSKWRRLPVDVLLPPRWTCSDNAWDSERRICSAPDEMNPMELEGFLRVATDSRKRRTVENKNQNGGGGGLTREISGLEALASAAVLGESIAETATAEPTTKHPRHRAGCTCIVCIQPPSGKGKHKPTCTCKICMTVKRRFKTLMLRKKKRQSDAEADSAAASVVPETFGVPNHPLSENNNGPIDLNCDPDREDVEPEQKRPEITNVVNLGGFPGPSNLQQQHGQLLGSQSCSLLDSVPKANNNAEESTIIVEEEEKEEEKEESDSTDGDGDHEVEDDDEDELLPPPPSDKTTTPPPQSDRIGSTNPDPYPHN